VVTIKTLDDILFEILFDRKEEYRKYLVPLTHHYYAPTVDPEDTIGTWIGYNILSKEKIVQNFIQGKLLAADFRIKFRLTALGPQAEDIVDSTAMWDQRPDVKKAFERHNAQLGNTNRMTMTRTVSLEGGNTMLLWFVDFTCISFMQLDPGWKPWIPLY